MIPRVHIVADDLTGALDSAAPFALRGATVRIACTPASLPDALRSGADVIAVATGTRDGSEAVAARVARQVAAQIRGRAGLVFKKIDSRLKGHIRVELDALTEEGRPLVVNPAVPRQGRFCVDGAVTGAGVETPIPVADRLGQGVEVSSARTAEDLARIVRAAPETALFVGAAGLAEALAETLHTGSAPLLPALPRPALLAIGSRDPVTLEQLVNLRLAEPEITIHAAPNGRLAGTLPPAPVTVLQMTAGDAVIPGHQASAAFSETVSQALATLGARTVFACGGESAAALLSDMGLDQLDLRGELLPGVPVARGTRPDAPWIVTKSGGFGTAQTLVELVKFLSDR